jgi:hypothetical protein
MKMTQLLLLLFGCLLPPLAFAQSAPTPSPSASAQTNDSVAFPLPATSPAPDAAELTKLLKDFLAGASRNDVAMHDRFWADDLIYTGSSGRRIGKAQIMHEVREEAAAPASATEPATTYSAEDIRIQQYGSTAIVAFRLLGTTEKGDKTEVSRYLNTGTFLKRAGQWKAVSWQATKIPAESSPTPETSPTNSK